MASLKQLACLPHQKPYAHQVPDRFNLALDSRFQSLSGRWHAGDLDRVDKTRSNL